MRKGNFVNRLDLEAKQEIKNYKNTVINQNIEMNKLTERITSLSDRNEERFRLIENKVEKNETLLSFLKKSSSDFKEYTKRSIDSLLNFFNKLSSKSNDIDLFINENSQVIGKIEEKLNFLSDIQYKSIEEKKVLQNSVYHQIDQLRLFLIERMDMIKKEIIEMPSGIEPIKEKMNKELLSYKVDFQGILREIQVAKKSMYVMQKNIENIYNSIERLK